MSDPFGLDAGVDQIVEALSPFGGQARDNALAIIQTVFSKIAEVTDVSSRPTTGADIETQLIGDFIVVEVNLQTTQSELFPCLTFIHREELAAAFDLDIPADPNDWSEQVDRLQNPVELLVEALNAHLAVGSASAPTFVRPSVRVVSLPDDAASLLLAPDEQLLEVSYQLAVADVGELAVVTVATMDLVHRLAESEGGLQLGASPSLSGVGAGGIAGLPHDLLGGLPDPFAAPTGRTSADILGDLGPLPGQGLGGLGMTGGSSSGMGGGGGRGIHDVPVRPAQFQQFGDANDRQPGPNIDLILDVNLRVTVELGRTQMSIREILDLGPGAVLELDKLAGEPVDILVNDKPIAKGEVVVVDENFGVRVTDIISAARRVASLR